MQENISCPPNATAYLHWNHKTKFKVHSSSYEKIDLFPLGDYVMYDV